LERVEKAGESSMFDKFKEAVSQDENKSRSSGMSGPGRGGRKERRPDSRPRPEGN
jgi:hypothetical protein